MDDFFKMDVFFAVTTFVVVVWGILGAVLIFAIVRVLRHIERLAKIAADKAEDIGDDIDDLRESVREEGVRMKHIFQFFTGAMASNSPRTKSASRSSHSARTVNHSKE